MQGLRPARKKQCKQPRQLQGSRGPAGRIEHADVACSKSIQKKGRETKKKVEEQVDMLHRGSIVGNN